MATVKLRGRFWFRRWQRRGDEDAIVGSMWFRRWVKRQNDLAAREGAMWFRRTVRDGDADLDDDDDGEAEPDLFSPLDDATLAAWFDGRDVADGAVASWTSRDPAGNVAEESETQPTAASGVVSFDGTNDTLSRLASAAKFVTGHALPDALGSVAGKGFTCTGMARATDGTIWVGNDGRGAPADLTHEPSLVHLASDFETKLGEIDLTGISGIESVQGVTYDSSDDTLWFCDKTNKTVRHYSTAGVDLADDIVLLYEPNGVGYHSVDDTLYISQDDSGSIDVYDASDSSFVETLAFAGEPPMAADQIFVDGPNGVLWTTEGTNGSAALVRAWSIDQLYFGTTYTLTEANAVEGGLVILGDRLYVTNDGFFHQQTPAVNRVLEYQISPPYSTKIDIWGVFRVPTAASPTDCVISCLEPIAGEGWGLYVPALTQWQLIGNTGTTGTTQRVVLATATDQDVTEYQILYAQLDTAGNATIWVNGTQVAQAAATAMNGVLFGGGVIHIGHANNSRFCRMDVKDIGWSVGGGSRQKIEGDLAHRHGLTGDLPAEHPHKASAP